MRSRVRLSILTEVREIKLSLIRKDQVVEPKGLVAATENAVEKELEERRGDGVRTLPTGLKSGIRSSGLFEAAGCK